MYLAIQILSILGFPFISQWAHAKQLVPHWLSPVVLCYVFGILLQNLGVFPLSEELSVRFTEIAVLLAIPLLLFSTDILAWVKEAGKTLLAYGLCVLSGLISVLLIFFLLPNISSESWRMCGMLIGMFTGGTPNMQAIGLALEAPQELIILVNAADIIAGGIYLVLLTSVMHPFLGTFLPDYSGPRETTENLAGEENPASSSFVTMGVAILLSILIVGASLGLCYLFFGSLSRSSFIILCLTTLSIAASLIPRVRQLKGSFEVGEYFLLAFCVALGMQANFTEMYQTGSEVILFTTLVLFATIVIHLFCCWLFRIDRDTVLITATAALYSPAFVGQIAVAIGNRALVLPGIIMGLLGFAIGNYLGIGVGYLFYQFIH